MNWWLAVFGAVILIFVLFDLLVTAFSSKGAGLLTMFICRSLWRFFLWVNGGKPWNKVLNYSGMIIMTLILSDWVLLFWLGSSLLYISDGDSVINTSTLQVADITDKIYFTGYVMSSMGLGDFIPKGHFWEIFTGILSFSGFIIITISITYLVPVISAITEQKSLSIFIVSHGKNPEEILLNSWNGRDFRRFNDFFRQMAFQIISHAQKHLAYPVLNYFHTSETRASLSVSLAKLDEAITLLTYFVEERYRPSWAELKPLRESIDVYLQTFESSLIKPSDESYGFSSHGLLRKYDLPVKGVAEVPEEIIQRRKIIRSMIENDGWQVENIWE